MGLSGAEWEWTGTSISVVGVRGAVFEVVRAPPEIVARYANPLARLPWWRADLILVVNPETRSWLPTRHHKKTVVFPHVVLDQPRADPKALSAHRQPTALFVGRLLPWKGMALALRALVLLDDWDMIVCGSGPDEHRLKRIAEKLKVDDRVKFLGWVSASRIRELMLAETDVLLFPSLHDEGGFVVAEALAAGLPVVCLKRGGPPEIGGTGVTPTGRLENCRGACTSSSGRSLGADPRIPAHRFQHYSVAAHPGDSTVLSLRRATVLGHMLCRPERSLFCERRLLRVKVHCGPLAPVHWFGREF